MANFVSCPQCRAHIRACHRENMSFSGGTRGRFMTLKRSSLWTNRVSFYFQFICRAAPLSSGLQQSSSLASCWALEIDLKENALTVQAWGYKWKASYLTLAWSDAGHDRVCQTQGPTVIKSIDVLLISFYRAYYRQHFSPLMAYSHPLVLNDRLLPVDVMSAKRHPLNLIIHSQSADSRTHNYSQGPR